MLEASQRLGGPLWSEVIGGRSVDTGPDGFLGRRPEAVDLCHEVGLADALVPIAARGASVWARGRLRGLPEGHALGIPTRFWPTARAGILGPRGVLALARDALVPRPDVRGPIGDRAIGPWWPASSGQRVVDVLTDPLIGGIHAGSVDDMSAAATFPPLLAAAQRRGSLIRALRTEVPPPPADGPPLFWSLRDGMGSLVQALAAALDHAGSRRPAVRAGASARARRPRLVDACPATRTTEADAVVLAMPATAAAQLLRSHDDEAAGLLEAIDYASVTVVTFRADPATVPASLVWHRLPRAPPKPPRTGDDPWAVTACTFLDRKWPHLAREGEVLLRASLGRIDDPRPAGWSDDEVAARRLGGARRSSWA